MTNDSEIDNRGVHFIFNMSAKSLFICAIFGTLFKWGRGEVVLGRETDEFDFDGLPGAQHEFKMSVGAGREECFFQKIVEGGKLHVSFEVIYSFILLDLIPINDYIENRKNND